MALCKNGMQGAPARRPLWKAQADTGRADYFRWTFKSQFGREIVLSVGKAHGEGPCHAASADTCEVLLWDKASARRDLMPEEVSCLLEPWTRFFDEAIALHMPDSILTALLFAMGYYFEETEHKANLLNATRWTAA